MHIKSIHLLLYLYFWWYAFHARISLLFSIRLRKIIDRNFTFLFTFFHPRSSTLSNFNRNILIFSLSCLIFFQLILSFLFFSIFHFLLPLIMTLNGHFHIILINRPIKFRLHLKIDIKLINKFHFIIIPNLQYIWLNFDLSWHIIFIIFINPHSLWY